MGSKGGGGEIFFGKSTLDPDRLFKRYQELQAYVGWTGEDARRVHAVGRLMEPCFPGLINDFYEEIDRHPLARKVITGGAAQVERLKGTLCQWVRDLFSGKYDQEYVARRWRVGLKHVEIGLDQVYTNVALSRIRTGLVKALQESGSGNSDDLKATIHSLSKLLDLDLATIEDAYQSEYHRQRLALMKNRSEAAFRTLVEAAPCLIVIFRHDFSIVYFSRFAEELTGYSFEKIWGKEFASLFFPEDHRKEAVLRILQVLEGKSCGEFETPIICKEEARRWLICNARYLTDYEEGPAILFVGHDITGLKRAQAQAVQVERLAAIGQMMTGLAHESGNALARSQACLEMLSLEVEDRPDALNLVARVQKAQIDLQQLYEEVRGYAAPLNLDLEEWDLSGIWRQAWENLSVLRRDREALLSERITEAIPRCKVDQFRLIQVFRNIFENSLAACPRSVRIEIACSKASVRGHAGVRIQIRDNGPGLAPEQRARIFEPFYTTKTKGTGLGMAIAKRIIEAHGGSIEVGNGPGPGAEIIMGLPRDRN